MIKRIAYLTGEYPRATDTFIQREVAELRKLGMEITTISVRRTSANHHVGPEQRAEAAGTHYLLPPNPVKLLAAHLGAFTRSPKRYLDSIRLAFKTRQPGVSGAMYQSFYWLEAGLVAGLLHRHRCEHLHNHFANSSCSVAVLASVMSGVPYSFTMHGPAIFFEPMRWRIDEKIAKATAVMCISHFCRSQGMAFVAPTHWDKMRIVHCGVDPTLFEKRRHDGRGRNLTYVGRLAAVKGLPILLDAMRELESDIRLTVIGDGPDRGILEQQARDLGLADRVDFVGYKSQTEVRSALSETDIFVMSSFAEGVPVVLMEAMASGVPVVATRIAGIAELVEDGVSGFLVPPGDADELTRRIRDLIADAPMRNRMGASGREKVEQEYDIRSEAAWLQTILTGGAGESLRPNVKTEAPSADAPAELDDAVPLSATPTP